jgi:hypothetical protein
LPPSCETYELVVDGCDEFCGEGRESEWWPDMWKTEVFGVELYDAKDVMAKPSTRIIRFDRLV